MKHLDTNIHQLLTARESHDPEVRKVSMWGLAAHPCDETFEALLDGVRDIDAEVREAASDALAEITTPEVLTVLKEAPRDTVTWTGVARTLAKMGTPEAVAVLGEALHDSSSDVWTTASLALADVGGAAAPALEKALRHEAPSVRARAAMALGRARICEAIGALIAATKDLDPSVRMEAVVAMAALHDDRGVPALVEALNDPEECVRQSVPVALGEIASESAIAALRQAAQHEDEAIRWISEWQLGEMGQELTWSL